MKEKEKECDICGEEIPEMLQKINRVFEDEPCYCRELNEVIQQAKKEVLDDIEKEIERFLVQEPDGSDVAQVRDFTCKFVEIKNNHLSTSQKEKELN